MLKKGDKVYTYDNRGHIASPVEGTVLDMHSDPGRPERFLVEMEFFLPDGDEGLERVIINGVYTPGDTRTKGGSEYVEIDSNNRFNCYLYLDRIYNLQLCVHLSVLFVNNAKHFCNEVLKELRGLGQEPPKDVIEMMNRFGLE